MTGYVTSRVNGLGQQIASRSDRLTVDHSQQLYIIILWILWGNDSGLSVIEFIIKSYGFFFGIWSHPTKTNISECNIKMRHAQLIGIPNLYIILNLLYFHHTIQIWHLICSYLFTNQKLIIQSFIFFPNVFVYWKKIYER